VIRKAAAGAVILGALYFLLFGGEYTFLDLWRLDREHEHEVAELEAIRVEVTELEEKADSLATDSAALERLAREQYGLIREGERLYRFVEPDTTEDQDPADPQE
jgi:cell division protein FtsB